MATGRLQSVSEVAQVHHLLECARRLENMTGLGRWEVALFAKKTQTGIVQSAEPFVVMIGHAQRELHILKTPLNTSAGER